jgi:hypothetical protein
MPCYSPLPAVFLSFRQALGISRIGVSASTPFIGVPQNNFSNIFL